MTLNNKLLMSAGVIFLASAIWHLLCILGGPSWFIFARAPQQIIDSAYQGTLLAPLGATVIASLMFSCTVFAFSAVGLIRQLPLIKPALIVIASLCTMRGLIGITTLTHSTGLDIWQIVASTVWFYVGICYIAGSIEYFKILKIRLRKKGGYKWQDLQQKKT